MVAPTGATALLARHAGLVRAYFARRVDCPEDAEDLSQETFCAILDAAARFRGEAAETTWVWAICRHVHAAWIRRQQRQRRLEDMLRQTVAAAPEPSASWVAPLDLAGALSRLSPALRDLYTERYLKGRGVREIASRLDLPEGTIKWRLSELRRRMRVVLNG